MLRQMRNVFFLGVKELRSVMRDPFMITLIIFAFTIAIYTSATAMPETLQRAPIAVVDEDQSALSMRIIDAFYLPHFMPPALINAPEMEARMDAGIDTFALHIPAGFQRDILAGRQPTLQLNIDSTRMTQSFTGAAYIQNIVMLEIAEFLQRERMNMHTSVTLNERAYFNPELNQTWFGGIIEMIGNITMLSLILTGAALIREREHGTVEHLLAMPLKPIEIMAAKVWSMTLIVLLATGFSLHVIIRGLLAVPIEGSLSVFFLGTALLLFATTSLGIFLATVARSMPQLAMLVILVILPLELLSGGATPREAMPEFIQHMMLLAPTTHFVSLSQAVLFRGSGLSMVWPELLILALIGALLFSLSLLRFRRVLETLA